MSLQGIQKNIQDYMLEVVPNAGNLVSSEADRLNIYSEGYVLRLVDCFSQDFPIFLQWIGKGKFETLAEDYLKHYPSTHFSIRYAGQYFADYLAKELKNIAWSEMVRFEWALGLAMDAKDAQALTSEKLATISPEVWPALNLKMHASVQLLALNYNIPLIWQALSDGTVPPELEKQERPVTWIVWMKELLLYYRSLSAKECAFLQGIQANMSLSDICEALTKKYDEETVIQIVSGTINAWANEGLLELV